MATFQSFLSVTSLGLCPVVQLRVGLSADVVPGGKPGPRRTKPLVMADTVGQSLQRKGDLMANQDTCLSALRGEILPNIDHNLCNFVVIFFFIELPICCKSDLNVFFLTLST